MTEHTQPTEAPALIVWLNKLRFRLGAWIIGRDMWMLYVRLWLVRHRAMQAVRPNGNVVLADCEALAEVLYDGLPGKWIVTVTLTNNDAASVSPSSLSGETT